MGKLFDNYIGIEKDDDISKYLKDREFYGATMNPRFMNAASYKKITNLKAPCLRRDMNIRDGMTLRIFINIFDIYYEIENDYRSLEMAGRFDPNNYTDENAIAELLDKILAEAL